MYPSTIYLGNTINNNYSFTSNNPFPPDNNNNNSTTIFEHSTTPNFSSFHPIHSPYSISEELQHFPDYYLHQLQQQETSLMSSMDRMEKHTEEDGRVNTGGSGLDKKYPVGVDEALYNNSTTSKQIPRKRSSKKDRHSKINTARGPRDRRMRLSLDVAQKFFGLQDMLGYDKASKTVLWLLTESKSAIKQVTNSISGGKNNNASNTASVSSTSNNSECEVLSGIINDESSLSLPREVTTPEKVKPKEKRPATSKAARESLAFRLKETREKRRAMAKARERTDNKRIRLENDSNYNNNMVKKTPFIEGMDQTLNQHLRSWSPFEASGGEESSTQIHNAPVTWSTSPFSSYHHNAAISHENQFMEFQPFGNPWDHQGYNN